MKIANIINSMWSLAAMCAALMCLGQAGCITFGAHSVPAGRLPAAYQAEPKSGKVPVNFTLLRQEPPKEYRLGAGDLVAVYVQGILPPKVDEVPIIQQGLATIDREVYPARGLLNTPISGVPVQINAAGELSLPVIDPVNLNGLTIIEAAEKVRDAYVAKRVLPEGKERVMLSLVRPRVHRVLVLREDLKADAPQFLVKNAIPYNRRGSGEVIDLPAYENDVLHVLASSGGLPGIETFNHVWVLKSNAVEGSAEEARARIESGEDAHQVFRALDAKRTAIRIPLRVKPGEPLPFGPQDVILHQGDIVYLETREPEVFYTGGLIPGGEVPLPRDRDIDVMEAVALANGSVAGPGGVAGAAVFRTGAGPGNIIPPTRCILIRKLANGQQLNIRCDLAKARYDQKERIIVQPGDFLMLNYKPGELASNVVLNFFNFNFLISPK